jgi:hypothetical protein
VDLLFFAANLIKLVSGAWLPLLIPLALRENIEHKRLLSHAEVRASHGFDRRGRPGHLDACRALRRRASKRRPGSSSPTPSEKSPSLSTSPCRSHCGISARNEERS